VERARYSFSPKSFFFSSTLLLISYFDKKILFYFKRSWKWIHCLHIWNRSHFFLPHFFFVYFLVWNEKKISSCKIFHYAWSSPLICPLSLDPNNNVLSYIIISWASPFLKRLVIFSSLNNTEKLCRLLYEEVISCMSGRKFSCRKTECRWQCLVYF
jgi:hypothetical protein